MSHIDCESVCVAAMALADGEESSFGAEEIELHLLKCEACRGEIEQMSATSQLLNSQKRLTKPANVWPIVSERLHATNESTRRFRWRVLLLFAIPLFGYKLFILILNAAPSLWAKLVPVILMIAIFTYLKVNPFKINAELTLKGEWS
jgi:predicted anti-sigma-YlaC factor YlaD